MLSSLHSHTMSPCRHMHWQCSMLRMFSTGKLQKQSSQQLQQASSLRSTEVVKLNCSG